jgi:uncharacterized Zn-binding protein involved in type VI secretion
MGQPAARINDMHVCPMQTPGVPPIPHVGGPIVGPGAPTVLIGGMPAAVMGDMATCTGPPDTILKGSAGVLICGKPAARMGDSCAHGGTIVVGCPTVLIGETMPGAPPVVVVPPMMTNPSPSQQSNNTSQSSSNASSSNTPPPQVKSPPPTGPKKTFVAIELKDEAGKPLVGERYVIELPDGSKKQGFLDMNGKARVDGIDPGNCKITFPDYGEKDSK